MPGSRAPGTPCGAKHQLERLAAQERRAARREHHGVAGHVGGARVARAGRPRRDLAVLDRLHPLAAQPVADGEAVAHAVGPHELCVLHAEGLEDALAHDLRERRTALLLDQAAEHREAMVGVRPLGPRGDRGAQSARVVVGQVGRRAVGLGAEAGHRPRGIGPAAQLAEPGGVREQVADGDRRVAGALLDADRPHALGDGVVERHAPLLDELEHADRGHGLGDRSDAEDGLAVDRPPGRLVGEPEPDEAGEAAAADDAKRQAGERVLVEALDRELAQVVVGHRPLLVAGGRGRAKWCGAACPMEV
jgi:hypothetical protein